MQIRTGQLVLASLLFFQSLPATLGKSRSKSPEHQGVKTVYYLGLFGGRAGSEEPAVKDQLAEAESDRQGFTLGLTPHVSFLGSSLMVNIGPGWRYTELRGTLGEGDQQRDLAIISRYGLLDSSFLFRFTETLAAGLMVMVPFGIDTTFDSDEKASRLPNVFAGGQISFQVKEPTRDDLFAFRVDLRAYTDVTVSKRQLQFFTLGLNIGMAAPSARPKVIVKEKIRTKVVVREKVRTQVRDRTKVQEIRKENYALEAGTIHFKTDQHSLSFRSRQYLSELGSYLRQNQHRWTRLILKSHADERGDIEYNQILANKRAQAVVSVLHQTGVPYGRIKIESFGESMPVERKSTDVSLARNRRAEIIIHGQNWMDDLQQHIVRLKQKHQMPATCNQGDCQ